MKILIIIIAFSFALSTIAQDVTDIGLKKATLVDEFGAIGCEELLARTEILLAQIKEAPRSRAVVTIEGNSRPFARIRRDIISRFQFAKAEDRIIFMTGYESPAAIKISFWKVPDDAPMPEGKPWHEPEQNVTTPFVFGYGDENSVCPTFVPKLFVDLIRKNPGAKANLVVEGPTNAIRSTWVKDWRKELIDLGLEPKRIRIFHVYHKNFISVEYWFVPATKSRRHRKN